MPEFRKVSKGLWASEDFQSLSPLPPSGQSLWLFLLTNPFPEFIPGIINAGPAACAEKLGWDADAIALAIGDEIAKAQHNAAYWGNEAAILREALERIAEIIENEKDDMHATTMIYPIARDALAKVRGGES